MPPVPPGQVLRLFKRVRSEVLAYKEFLRSQRVAPGSIRNFSDFQTLPLMDKKNYITKYPWHNRVWSGSKPDLIHASSGSTGPPTLWFRHNAQERAGGTMHEIILRDIYKIKKADDTLVIICFSMGIWVAGLYTYNAFRYLASRGYKITIAAPGLEKQTVINLFKIFPQFKNVILAGYPPFLAEVIHALKNAKVYMLTGGDTISEDWRERNGQARVINLYGSAEAGLMAYETPFSIWLRKKSARLPVLREWLFGAGGNKNALFQYHPNFVFFESVKGELAISADLGAPLLRYNLHDRGQVFSYQEVALWLERNNLLKEIKKRGFDIWRLPLVAVAGRTDVAVTFYALNIYPENITAGLDNETIRRKLSGNFLAYQKDDKRGRQSLRIDLELADKQPSQSSAFKRQVNEIIFNGLQKSNMEYKKLYDSLGEQALPVIKLYPYGRLPNSQPSQKTLLNLKGSKPKIIL